MTLKEILGAVKRKFIVEIDFCYPGVIVTVRGECQREAEHKGTTWFERRFPMNEMEDFMRFLHFIARSEFSYTGDEDLVSTISELSPPEPCPPPVHNPGIHVTPGQVLRRV